MKASKELINDLNILSELPFRIKNAQTIIKIEAYVTTSKAHILDSDSEFNSLL
jgi:hypothetical protein